ncbi:MAG TPA: cupin domain-containing protein [Solirubrobacteraceae bacterium]|jgi:quercetin dioxygenase-like cupin family protein|nr:cupin domain-containing protein [Solirubrobacteraceae bacterium]
MDSTSLATEVPVAGSPVIARGPGDGLTVEAPVGVMTFKARAEQTHGTLTAIESVIPPGKGPPLHVHRSEDEFIYVLEGRLGFRLEDALREAPAGAFVFIPRGSAHTWQAIGDAPARFLFGFTPAAEGMERFFERASELPAATRGPEAFRRFGADAGMDVLGPPLAEPAP